MYTCVIADCHIQGVALELTHKVFGEDGKKIHEITFENVCMSILEKFAIMQAFTAL